MTAFGSGNIFSSQLVDVPVVVEDYIWDNAPWETPLLMEVGMDSLPTPCTDVKYEWYDQDHKPGQSTINGSHSSGSTQITITDPIYKQGDEIQVGQEIIKLGTTSDNLVFTSSGRSRGAATAAALLDGQQVISLDKLFTQGTAMGAGDIFIMPTKRTTYTSIIKREPFVSGTANALPRHGRDGTEYDYQAAYQLRLSFKFLEARVLWGYTATPSAGSTAGAQKGIYECIRGTLTNAGGLDIDLNDVRTHVRANRSFGASPEERLIMLCPLYTKDVIDSWGQAYVSRQIAETEVAKMVFGSTIDVLSVGGRKIELIPYPFLETELFILQPNRIGVGPLQGRAMQHTYYGKEGDRVHGEILGEYTDTCANAAGYAHAVFTNLKKA